MNLPIRAQKLNALMTVLAMLVGLTVFMPATPVYASTVWTVNDASDTAGNAADVTLRYAMIHAQSGDTINFADSIIGQCYYTTDGSDPRNSSTRIASNGLIPVSSSGTIRAANHTSAGWSDVKTATFSIGGTDSPREPIIFPFEGNYSSAQTVYIYSPGADWLYYTTDGTDPASSSTRTAFQGCFTSVTVSQTETIKAIANYGSSGSSNIAEAHLSIGGIGPLTAPVITPNGGSFAGPLLVDICNKAGTIYLSSPLPKINQDLTINGPGAESLAISGNYQTRVFEVTGGNVLISGLTVENGWVRGNTGFDGGNGIAGGGGGGGGAAEGGGGMLVKGGTITIDGVYFYNNQAIGGSGGNGGAGFTGQDDYGDGGNGAVSDLIDGSTGGHGGIAPFSAVDFGIFHLSDARPGADAVDGFRFGGGGGGSGLNSNNEPTGYSVGGLGGQDVNGTAGVGPNGVGYNTNGSKGGNGGTGGYAHIESFNNSYYGGNGGNGGDAYGGAICLINGAVQVQNSAFMGNTVLGGTGGAGGISYQGFSNGQTLDSFIFSIGSTMLSGNRGQFESWWKLVDFGLSRVGNAFAYEAKSSTAYPYGGYPGNGGNAEGGAIYVSPYNGSFGWNGAPLVMVNCTFGDNGAFGGYPGPVTNWTGVSGSFGQEFASDIANKTNNAHVDIRNVIGADSNLGDIRELSQPSAIWSEIEANNLKPTCGTDVVTISVSIRDSSNLPVWGEKVVLNQGGGHSQISPSSAITDNDGNATFTVIGTKAETIEYTATFSNITISGKPFMLWDGWKDVPWTESKVIFSAGPPNAQTSTVSSSHSTITADGVSEATITVHVADAGGNTLSGKQVTLNQGAGRSVITPATATTDSNGEATFIVTNVYDESVTYAASVGSITVNQTATVTFSQYAWVVDNLGDGLYPGTLRYAVGNAPSGTTIVFKTGISGTINLYGPLPKINKDLTIDGSGSDVIINGQNLYRIFEVNGGTVSIKGIALVNGKAAGSNGATGGVSPQYGYGISGESGLSGLGGGLLITNGTVSVDNISFINNQAVGGRGGNGGNATGSGWTGGGGGTAGNGGIGQGGAIYLSNGTLSVTNSTFTNSSAIGGSGGTGGNGSCYGGEGGIGADGNGGAIYVNAGSLTISNINFASSSATGGNGGNGGGGGNTTAGEHGFGGGNGWGGALYINTGTFTATDCQFSDGMVAGGTLGTGIHGSIGSAGSAVAKDIYIKNCTTLLNNVTFSSDTNSYVNLTPADAGQSEVTTSPSSVFSNGTSKSTVKVTLRRSNGIPASGKAVTLTAGSGSSSITSLNSITDSNGEAIFTVSDRIGETVTYTARDTTDNITVTKVASVTFLPPDADQSTVTLNSANVLADGTEASTITVVLKYSDGTPAIGKTVTLIPGNGSSHITSTNNSITDNNGAAIFNVTDSQAETVVYTAKDITDNIIVTQTATVTYRPYDWKVKTLNDGNSLGTLRYAIQNAPIGTTITFQSGLTGTIVLTGPLPVINRDMTINGSGANVTISGNNQYRVFEVDSGNVAFRDLTVADGKATGNAGSDMTYNWYDVIGVGNNGGNGASGNGGGLFIMNGTVTLEGVTFMDNKAIGGKGGLGGNGAQVNTGGVGGTGGDGNGGAIFLNSGSLTIVDSGFSGNYAFGGTGGRGGNAHVYGGNGGAGGNGNGGAIFVDSGSLVITDSQLSGNGISGGNGGVGGQSGTVWGGSADGSIGAPGSAIGSNLYNRNGTVQLSFVTISTENNSYYNLPSINTITYDSQGGSPISSIMNSASIAINTPDDPILPGYAFGGWYKEPDCTNAWNFSTDKVIGEITLYAKWTAIYSVTFFAPYSNPPPVMNNVLSGSKINQPTDPTWAGFTFEGWYKESECINAWDFSTDTVTGHITLYAKWQSLPSCVVIFYTQNGNLPAIIYVYSGYIMSEPSAPTRFGYEFEGWYKESECLNSWDFSTDTVTSDVYLYAKWTALPTFTVTFDAQEGNPASSTVSVYSGYTVSEPAAPTQLGYVFGGWYKEPACINDWDFITDIVTEDLTLYAKWTAIYSVTFNPQNGSQPTVVNNVLTGSTINEPAEPSWTGYTFLGWYKESEGTHAWNFSTDVVTGDAILYANWTTLPTYTVIFDAQGGSPASSTKNVYAGYTVSEPAEPTQYGYSFEGWYKEAEGTNAWDFTTDVVTGDAILFAMWTALPTYTVAFDAQGGSPATSTESVYVGYTMSEPAAPTQSGYIFEGWYKETACTNAWDFGMDTVTSDITLYAKWTALPTYTVTFDAQSGSPVSSINNVISGSTISAPSSPTQSGYNFGGWYKEPACTNAWNFSTDTVTGDITLYARWTALPTYTVTFDPQNGSQITDLTNVVSGSTISPPYVPTQAGYTFEGWYKEPACINAWNFSTDTVTGDITLYARWTALPTYTVTFDSQGGSPVLSTNTVISGSIIITPSIPTQAGYTFGGWYKEPSCTNAWNFGTDIVTGDVTLYAKWTAFPTYTVTFEDWDGTVLKTVAVNVGSAATAPANPNRTGYTFTGWDKDFSNVTSDLTVAALYSYSGGGGHTSNEISTTETINTETTVIGNSVTATTTSTAETDDKGNATAEVTEEHVSDAVDQAVAGAAKQGESAVAIVEIKVTAPENAKTIGLSIPKAAVSELVENNINGLEVSTPIASLSFDQNALASISQAAAGDVTITTAEIDSSVLPETTRQIVGDRPVFEFSVESMGNTISQFDGSVTVSVPYTPKMDEDTNAIVIFYINAEGELEIVSNCAYDPVTGNITFTTSHFSQYAVGYNKVSFADVPAQAWYSKAVEFIAARGVTLGTGNGNYSPEAKLTRGEFLVIMMRAYGIAPDTNSKDNFADVGNTYSAGYLAAAKRLGISAGVGNNMFAYEKEITRQELFTLMYNVLKVINALPSGTSEKQLSSFVDTGLISPWAMDAMQLFVETGIISGNGDKLSPTSTSTRAELAQVIYTLMSK